jgi:hypothetical protein|mmetsp:Transcript_31399/g.53189  ORF Transcript_31399/g.53189 Transcript_31399/m.53189 type:complete len:83 (-) Transcript_31399:98-346(-)
MPPAHSSFSSSTCTALTAVSFEDFCQYLAHIPQLGMSSCIIHRFIGEPSSHANAHSSILNLIRAPINVAHSCLAIQGRGGHS